MEIITGHINTDFDSLAAMIAARLLYPQASLVFPGSQEKNVRDYLAQEFPNIYDFKKIKDISMESVTRLIAVDTRRPGRIGRLRECLTNPDIEIHLYDHHPDSPDDLKGTLEVVEQVGSVTTLFCRIFKEKGIIPSRDEATLMALGIYEDTGFFLHSTTTPADLEAGSWLLTHGANLDVVSQFISHDLNATQVAMLSELHKQSTTYTIQSVRVTVARMTLPEFVGGFAGLLRRLMVMENLDALFGLICMNERTYLIGRSRIPEINAGSIVREFGGGGHASAASATISEMTIIEAEEKLIRTLHHHIRPRSIAGEIMSSPVLAVPPSTTIDEANQLLTRYNVTVLPVASNVPSKHNQHHPTGLLGMISRGVIEKAISHKLGHLPVNEYMTTDIATLPADATLADIQEMIIEHRQRLIPVIDDKKEKNKRQKPEDIIGVITRTDLLNLLTGDPAILPENLIREDKHPSVARTRNMSRLMSQRLDKEIIILLKLIGETAAELKLNCFVVGGFVRDMLLHIENMDIDIVIEGDGIFFAKKLAEKNGGTVRTHEKFGTAKVILPGNHRIDVATARLEYYEYPAAMPTVELSSLKLDLYRRDFTINAMAIALNPERFGTLVDFFHSQNDLKARSIRVLHNLSFVEDPTRIFRAIRFEQKLDFRITKHTEKLIKNAVKLDIFNSFSGIRFFNELKQIFAVDNPLPALRRIDYFSLFPFLWPDLRPNLKIDRRFIHLITQASRAVSWFKLLYLKTDCAFWPVYLLAIMSRSGTKELTAFCKRFEVSDQQKKMLLQQKHESERIAIEMLHRPYLKNSEIYWLLLSLENEGLLYLITIARRKHIKKAVSLFVTNLRDTKTMISGTDLKTIGFSPGPIYKTIINFVLEAQLNGQINSKEEAISLVKDNYRP
jgi:tRNA nucleotidyltransferase (CCA-adding enzyme)